MHTLPQWLRGISSAAAVQKCAGWLPSTCRARLTTTATAVPPKRRPQRKRVYEYVEAPDHVRQRPTVLPEDIAGARSLNVAIVGAPNAGKSTLLNALVRSKVSAVSRKYNTTRNRVCGVLTEGATQIVFYDTPGFLTDTGVATGPHKFIRSLVTAATDAVPEADVVLYMLDAAKRFDDVAAENIHQLVALARAAGAHVFAVANKCDLLTGAHLTRAAAIGDVHTSQDAGAGHAGTRGERERRALAGKLDLIESSFERACIDAGIIPSAGFDACTLPGAPPSVYAFFPPVRPLSALRMEGIDSLRSDLLRLAVPRAWDYHSKLVTDLSPLERVAEVVREHLFHHLHDEVPYRVSQVNRSWRTLPDGAIVIDQDLQVPSRAAARMLKARGGAPLRLMTQACIRELQDIFSTRVHLFLHVAIKEGLSRGEAV